MFQKGKLPESFPNKLQETFLRAALYNGKEADQAWIEWKSQIRLDDVDFGTFRLLSLLYKNLQARGVDDPLMPKLKGIYRYNWVKNQRLLFFTSTLLDSFECEHIPVMVLKGLPLTLLAYKDLGLRFMNDIDMLVPPEKAVHAIKCLVNSGFTPKLKPLKEYGSSWVKAFVRHHPYCTWINSDGMELDLHWSLTYDTFERGIIESLWKRALLFEIHGRKAKTLDPADMLVHVCRHGVKWNALPPIRWVADASMILKTWPGLDWERVTELTERMNATLYLKDALSYLKTNFNAAVPDQVLSEFSKKTPPRWLRREYEISTKAANSYRNLRVYRYYYKRLRETSPEASLLEGFPSYYKYISGLDHLYQLPSFIFAKMLDRYADWKRPAKGATLSSSK